MFNLVAYMYNDTYIGTYSRLSHMEVRKDYYCTILHLTYR